MNQQEQEEFEQILRELIALSESSTLVMTLDTFNDRGELLVEGELTKYDKLLTKLTALHKDDALLFEDPDLDSILYLGVSGKPVMIFQT